MTRSTLLPRFTLSSKKFAGSATERAMAESSRRPSASKAWYRPSVDSRKPGNAVHPDVRRHDLVERMSGRQLAADVPELLEIVVLGALGGFDAERRVAARAAAVRHLVAQLFGFDGSAKNSVETVQALVDEPLVDPVVLDDDEAEFRVGRGDVVRELRRSRPGAHRVWERCRSWAGYCAYRVRDVEVGNAGWEIPGPQRSFAVRQRHFDGSP